MENPEDVKVTIRIKEVNYNEELSEKLGGICHTGNIESNNFKTFKHLIEYDGHTWLIESTYAFQQMDFDKKSGYVPHFVSSYVREIDLKDYEAKLLGYNGV